MIAWAVECVVIVWSAFWFGHLFSIAYYHLLTRWRGRASLLDRLEEEALFAEVRIDRARRLTLEGE